MRTFPFAAIVLCVFGVAGHAFAGDYNEGGDAGQTTSTAQSVTGAPGPVMSITGRFTPAGVPFAGRGPGTEGPLGDSEDVYEIFISDPTTFSATTFANGGFAEVGTELFLFAANGQGLLANDNATNLTNLSTLPNASNDGTGVVINAPGIYFLAISREPDKPLGAGLLIFNQAGPGGQIEVSGPDGPGGGIPMDDWNNTTMPEFQEHYNIVLTGVSYIPAAIPTVSEWGLIVLTLLLLTAATILFSRRRMMPAAA